MPELKIGAIVRCYRITEYLERVLRNLSDIDLVVLAHGAFEKVSKDDTDNTLEIVRSIPQKNILVKLHEGKAQKDVFNECLEHLQGMDFVLVNDADEFLLREDRNYIFSRMVEKGADAGMCSVIDYSPDGGRYLLRTHKPVVAIRPYCQFDGNRSVGYGQGVIEHETYLHHFGYALSRDNTAWKEKNLWYPAESLVQGPTEPFNKPSELLKVLNE